MFIPSLLLGKKKKKKIILVGIATLTLLMVPYARCSSWNLHSFTWPIKYLHNVPSHSGTCPLTEQLLWVISHSEDVESPEENQYALFEHLGYACFSEWLTGSWCQWGTFTPGLSGTSAAQGAWNNNSSASAATPIWTIFFVSSEKISGWALPWLLLPGDNLSRLSCLYCYSLWTGRHCVWTWRSDLYLPTIIRW